LIRIKEISVEKLNEITERLTSVLDCSSQTYGQTHADDECKQEEPIPEEIKEELVEIGRGASKRIVLYKEDTSAKQERVLNKDNIYHNDGQTTIPPMCEYTDENKNMTSPLGNNRLRRYW